MKKILSLILLLGFVCTTFSACYDANEIDEEIYPLVLGLDKGTSEAILLTIQFPTYKGEGGGGGGGGASKKSGDGENEKEPAPNILSIESPTIPLGIERMAMGLSRNISLTHTKMFLISETLAREGLSPSLSALMRSREIRENMDFVVINGTARSFIEENKPIVGESIAKMVELLRDQSDITDYYPRISLLQFYRSVVSPYESPIAAYGGVNDFDSLKKPALENPSPASTETGFTPGSVPRIGGSKRDMSGAAVFQGDTMVGTLDSQESRYYKLITGDFKQGLFSFADPQNSQDAFSVDLRTSRAPKVEAKLDNQLPKLSVFLQLEGDIEEIQSRIPYEDPKNLDRLQQYIHAKLEAATKSLISKTQREFKADIFGFGKKVAGLYATIPAFEKANWHALYPNTTIDVTVALEIRRTGITIQSAPILSLQAFFRGGDDL